jgi:hypothetical protein
MLIIMGTPTVRGMLKRTFQYCCLHSSVTLILTGEIDCHERKFRC